MAAPTRHEDLVLQVPDGRWMVAYRRGDLYVAPVHTVHRFYHGNVVVTASLRDVAACGYGFTHHRDALAKARDLYPYIGFRKGA